ncbi:DUF86 domain-containing protein [candidate division KSB1 bacterium]|nr:DUF86 domain-containing protein [candidate division KSB1 bacterium]NIR70203.1 DUF86 domain-containing protein [candidate division KSB1 bacterium]NIS27590.1 DUF86 domain-containing protein [candidate division KSB1 bacterium]NIT74442.1 DUF86 domain-containing protein [candidate division KSB1 bacterium]NIU28307.1 DUF86 domain-containing protein [candidate division KSB1 bacterium]
MLEKDVVLSKISIIKHCLDRIKKVTNLAPDSLENFDKQDIFVLNLQRAIQACIDIANLIISKHDYRLPNSYKMSFYILFENKWINSETCKRMQKMVGFRNIAIYDYQEVDTEILKSILTKNLSDFEKFYKQIHKKIAAS